MNRPNQRQNRDLSSGDQADPENDLGLSQSEAMCKKAISSEEASDEDSGSYLSHALYLVGVNPDSVARRDSTTRAGDAR